MVRRVLIPTVLALGAFVLLMPMVCVGSSDDPQVRCETFYQLTIPGSSIDGPASAVMYVVPVVAAIVTFLVARAALRPRAGSLGDTEG